MSEYQIQPIDVTGFAPADGVIVNDAGEWLGEVVDNEVHHYADEGGDYVPAPEGWRDVVTEALRG